MVEGEFRELVRVVTPVREVLVGRHASGCVVIAQANEDGAIECEIRVPRTEAANLAKAIKEAAKAG